MKSAILYRVELPAAKQLYQHFSTARFNPLLASDYSRAGFIPNPEDGDYVSDLGESLAFTVQYDEKILPASVVTAELKKREKEADHKLSKTERSELKDKIYFEFLAVALTKSTKVTCFYHVKEQLLFVPTASKKLAGIVVSRLLKELGSIKAETVFVTEASHGLTTKLKNYLASTYNFENFYVEGFCKLKHSGVSSFKTNVIEDARSGILEAIADGGKITEIGLSNDDVSFRIDTDFKLKGISFLSEPPEEELDWFQECAVQIILLTAAIKDLLKLFEYDIL